MPPKRTSISRRAPESDDQPNEDEPDRPSKRSKRQPSQADEEEMADNILVSSKPPSTRPRVRPRKESEDPLALPAESSSSPAGQSARSSKRVTRGTVVEVVVPAMTGGTSGRSAGKSRTSGSSAKVTTKEPKLTPKSKLNARAASPSPAPSHASFTSTPASASRISTRVPKLSQRALDSGHFPPPRRIIPFVPIAAEPSGVGPSPLRNTRRRGQSPSRSDYESPSPSRSVSRSPSIESDPDQTNPDINNPTNLKAQQTLFLSHERTLKAREARNFNWEGQVDEPRRLRGGKVVEVEKGGFGGGGRGGKGKRRGRDFDEDEEDADEDEFGLRRTDRGGAEGSGTKDFPSNGKGKVKARFTSNLDEDPDEPDRSDLDMLDINNPFLIDDNTKEEQDRPDYYMDDLTYDDLPGAQNNRNGRKRGNGIDIDDADGSNIETKETLSPNASLVLQHVLDTLISRPTISPPPFPDEPSFSSILHPPIHASNSATQPPPTLPDHQPIASHEKDKMKKHEALTQLVGLLMGTVGRGEGNSCLVLGGKGSGKTRTVNRAISLIFTHLATSGLAKTPIVVRLDGLAQTNDMLAIREMGRQIAIGEGRAMVEDEGDDEEGLNAENYAPTTLPAHLLALLTQPSERAIVIVIDHFDLFTQHARQALLYCLLDVVQSVRPGSSATTGRGVAVVGLTSRVDTTLLLEKRVKSRFSQRVFRVASPLSGMDLEGCKSFVRAALIPKLEGVEVDDQWSGRWEMWVEATLNDESVGKALQRLSDVTSEPRLIYRPFIRPIIDILSGIPLDSIEPKRVAEGFMIQLQESGWHAKADKLRGLSAPALVVLIISKHFSYAGKEEFNFAMAEHEYHRFAQSALAGSGRGRWSDGILRMGWDQLLRTGLLFPATRFRPNPNPYMHKFLLCRSLLSRNEIVAYFKGDGAKVLGTELSNWGRTAGGHA